MGKNQAAMGKGIVVKSPTKKSSVTKSSAPSSAMPAYKKGGMTKMKMGGSMKGKKC